MKPPLQRIEEFLESPELGEYSISAGYRIKKLESALSEAVESLESVSHPFLVEGLDGKNPFHTYVNEKIERIAYILDGGEE